VSPEEGSFWHHHADLAKSASARMQDLIGSLEGQCNTRSDASSTRLDWPCGSFFDMSLVSMGPSQLAWRIATKIRQGPVEQEVFELSPYTRPAEPDSVPLAEVSLEGVFPDHPFGEVRDAVKGLGPIAPVVENLVAVVDRLSGAKQRADLSVRAQEVLSDLDGARKWTREAKEYWPCVVCEKAVKEGDLYEFQRGKSSPRRRVHVTCLRALGCAL